VAIAAAGEGSFFELDAAPPAAGVDACSFPVEEEAAEYGAAETGVAEDAAGDGGAGTAAEGLGTGGFAGLVLSSNAAMLPGLGPGGKSNRFAANSANASTATKKTSPNTLFLALTRILRRCVALPQDDANLAP
jgi:hypothetical protein